MSDQNSSSITDDFKVEVIRVDRERASILTISALDGRHLLSIHQDGRVEGEVADASEAARVFAKELSRIYGGITFDPELRL